MREGWTYKKLGEVATFINGYAFKPDQWKDSGTPIVRIQNLNNPEAPYNYYDGEVPDKVWFYDMQADGYSLDQKRTEVTENDIPDVITRFHNLEAEAQRTRKDKSFLVPVDEIRNNDYVLSINKYKEVEREKVEYDSTEVIQGRIEALESEIAAAINEFRTKFM